MPIFERLSVYFLLSLPSYYILKFLVMHIGHDNQVRQLVQKQLRLEVNEELFYYFIHSFFDLYGIGL